MTEKADDKPLDPPHPRNADGQTRNVGVEIEFAGLDCDKAAEVVAEGFGGEITQHDLYRYSVDSPAGTFEVELDTQFVHAPEAQERLKKKAGDRFVEEVSAGLREAVGEIGSTLHSR